MNSLSLLQSVRGDADWTRLRFSDERSLREKLAGDRQALAQWESACRLDILAPLLVGWQVNGVYVCDEDNFPSLHRLAGVAQRILRLPRPVQLIVFPCPILVAFAVPQQNAEAIRIAFSSSIPERLWVREALFLMGRAIARTFLNEPWMLADLSGYSLGDVSSNPLHLLWRYEELFADRVGLICCQDVDIACQAIVKTVSGITKLPQGAMPPKLHTASQFPKAESFLEQRLRLLREFSQSAEYIALLGTDAPTATEPAEPTVDRVTPVELPVEVPIPAEPAEEMAAPLELQLDDPSPARALRNFTVCSTLCVLSMKDCITDTENELLSDLFGDESVQLWRLAIETRGEVVLWETCQELAPRIAREFDLDTKLGIIREILSVVLAEGPLCPRENDTVVELANWIGLSEDDLSPLAAEYVDPEYALYHFEQDQQVEVLLDGQWVRGVVEEVAPTGDLRVHFIDDGETFHLNPVADLVRPVFQELSEA